MSLNVAKYYLGKVKRERSWPVVSAFAVRDLRGGPWILQGLLWARGQCCLCIVALLADRIGSIAYYCHGSLQRVADSRSLSTLPAGWQAVSSVFLLGKYYHR